MRLVVALASVFYFTLCEGNFGKKYDPDILRNVSQLISSKGYPVEDHTVNKTADGYILSVQRIPHGRNKHNQGDKKKVVFLQHGFVNSAADWVLNLPNQSLAFILADEGYDVWLGNTRGNTYSRRHIKYTTDDSQFWNFSYDQLARYDLPAMIDYVLNTTGAENCYYIGHSQGTLLAFALLSENPEYNEKIKLFIALAPVITVAHMTFFPRHLIPYKNEIEFLFRIFNVNEFLPNGPFFKFFSKYICSTKENVICKNILFTVFGKNEMELNESRVSVYYSHIPAGTSAKNVNHFFQNAQSGKFAMYDYGKDNQKHYNQSTPPEYDVSRITTPVALVWSMGDNAADPVDVAKLQSKLTSMVSSYCVPLPEFNHLDFLVAVHARELIHDHVLSLLAHY